MSVYIGNQKAKVIYAGRSGGYAGLDQINVEVPDVPAGCFVPVVVHSESEVSNYVTIAVDKAGGGCANPSGVPADLLASAAGGGSLRLGAIALGPMGVLQSGGFRVTLSAAQRVSAVLGVEVAESDVVRLVTAMRSRNQKTVRQILAKYKIAASDLTPTVLQRVRKALRMDYLAAAAAFGTFSRLDVAGPQVAAIFPASGTCTVLKSPPYLGEANGRGLDAGNSLTLTGPFGSRVLTSYRKGEYETDLGAGFGLTLPAGLINSRGAVARTLGPSRCRSLSRPRLPGRIKSRRSTVHNRSPSRGQAGRKPGKC